MLKIQELANFISENLNIISATAGASYVFDIYAEVGHNENDGHIKGVVRSLQNNPLIVKSLVSVKTVYAVELSIPVGMANKNLAKIEEIVNKFAETYEDTQHTFTTGVGSFEFTFAHLPKDFKIDNTVGATVPLAFEITVNFTDDGLLGSSKVWLLNGVEIPYLNEVILLSKEGQTNRISKEKYNKTIVLAQTKFYKFTIPFDKTNTVCTTLQADLLAGDFDKTYTLTYYDGTTYTSTAPFTTTVSLYQSGDSASDGGAISKFTVTFADVSATELAPKYTLQLFSTPFDDNNERYFDSIEEQTAWYDTQIKTPEVQIKAPTLNTIFTTTQVYNDASSGFTASTLANMNIARINEKTTEPITNTYTINQETTKFLKGNISGNGYEFDYRLAEGESQTINLYGIDYRVRVNQDEIQIVDGGGGTITLIETEDPSEFNFKTQTYYYLQETDDYYAIVDEQGQQVVSMAKTDTSIQFYVINDILAELRIDNGSIYIYIGGVQYADITATRQFYIESTFLLLEQNPEIVTQGWIAQGGQWVTSMQTDTLFDWKFTLDNVLYYANYDNSFTIYEDDVEDPIASNVVNGGEFTIVGDYKVNRYYYTIQSSEIGANNQIILTLKLNTFQTYIINPDLRFSECFINKAHLNRFVDNGDGTVSFNGGIESPLFEREEAQNVAKRLVAREVLKYDYGKYNIEDYAPSQVDRFRRVEDWLQNNVVGWLYAFFPKKTMSVYDLSAGATQNVDFGEQRYRTYSGGNTVDSPFIVFCSPLYKSGKRMFLKKIDDGVSVSMEAHKDGLMAYLQKVMWAGENNIPYTLKFSTKPPISNINTNLMGFDVDANGNLVSLDASTYINYTDNKATSMSCYDFKAIRTTQDVYGSSPDFIYEGCFVCENSFLPTLDLEDYIIINPIRFPKQNTNYIDKTFYKLNRYNLAKTVPQSFALVRPGINVTNISITISYQISANSGSIGTWQIPNEKGRYNFGGCYALTIKDSSMVFEILQLETGLSYFNYVEFKERVYGIVGADKNPIYNPKLLNSDYRSLRLTNEKGGEFEYDIQKLNTEVLQTAVTEQITADLQRTYFRAINTDGVYQLECSQNLTGLVDSSETSMPLATEPWKKTLAEQPNYFTQQALGFARRTIGSVVGGAGIGASGLVTPDKLNPKAIAFGAVSGMMNSALDLVEMTFTKDNMDRQPNLIQNANGNVVFNLSYTTPGMTIEQYALLPQEERIINDQMFANGYTYNRIDQIRNFMHTRKYFNTLIANIETMSGLPLSNEVREDIKQRFANGIRLWHTDEIQYDLENYELWLEEE